MNRFFRALSVPMAATVFVTGAYMPVAQAAMVPTEQIVRGAEHAIQGAAAERERLATLLTREDVREEMQRLGVDANEAMARIAALSDEEVRRIAGQVDQMVAGGDVGGILGVILLIAVVLLITDILCFTHVYPFTRCLGR